MTRERIKKVVEPKPKTSYKLEKQQPSHVGLVERLRSRKEATDAASKTSSESIWKQGKGGT